ncbi:hypothetical protein BD410DRAFT_790412 [Rickenella mellea]|uniref:F-box domain-containing protein n=1 Tax=Rickenella mellea TaxID=50990 RepID=A0A4Y7Q0B1_9AGAM|nr:hypothetical protein BD410DRAFT_790412 [Rickenella mellea]
MSSVGHVRRSFRLLPFRLRKRRKHKSIKDLPTELLIQIFLDCLSLKEFPRPSTREAPVSLTRVCRRWRSIASSTPQLWAAITSSRSQSEERDVMALDVWIKRSGTCPLSVSLRHGVDYHCVAKCVQTILPYACRWKAVYLMASERCICLSQINKVLSTPDGTPLLEDFRAINVPGSTAFPGHVFPDLSAAPRPSTLHLGGDSIIHLIRPYSTKFHAMRELRLHECENTVACLHALNRCPSLEILEIALKNRSSSNVLTVPGPSEMHAIPLLHTLLVTGSLENARPFIDHIRLPAVLRLSIFSTRAKSGYESSMWPHVTNLIVRSGGNLEELRIDGHIGRAGGFSKVLRCANSLKSLSVGNPGYMLAHMNILKPSLDMSYILCPQLDRFEFLGAWNDMDILGVADILVYRWRHSRNCGKRHSSPSTVMFELKECVYTFQNDFYISECVDEGMKVAELDCSDAWWLSNV